VQDDRGELAQKFAHLRNTTGARCPGWDIVHRCSTGALTVAPSTADRSQTEERLAWLVEAPTGQILTDGVDVIGNATPSGLSYCS
jgi:hypothetical protein